VRTVSTLFESPYWIWKYIFKICERFVHSTS